MRPDPVVFAIAASLLALASQGVRYQAWFALAAAILGARSVAAAGGGPGPLPALVRRAGGAAIAVAVAVSLVVVLLTSDAAFEQLSPEAALAATGAYLERHPAARILADADASSALLWTQPRSIGHVAFDARLEQFPQGRLRRWFDSIPGPKQLIRPRLDSHFFRGHEAWLVETVSAFLDGQWRGYP